MLTTVIFVWLICVAIAALIRRRRSKKNKLPKAPQGMIAVKCRRCNAVQNIAVGQEQFECWQCKTVGPVPGVPTAPGG